MHVICSVEQVVDRELVTQVVKWMHSLCPRTTPTNKQSFRERPSGIFIKAGTKKDVHGKQLSKGGQELGSQRHRNIAEEKSTSQCQAKTTSKLCGKAVNNLSSFHFKFL